MLGHAASGHMLLDGRFQLAGERVDLVQESWFPDDAPTPWLKALHSFEWLDDLAATEDPEAGKAARHMVSSWITHNRRWHPLSWDGEVTARRLLSWLSYWRFITQGADALFVRRVTQDLAVQANHLLLCYQDYAPSYQRFLIEKALIYCGHCLPDGNTLASDMLERLEESLDRLIRTDGGTQYRSPFTQAHMLIDLHDLQDFHRMARLQSPRFIAATIQRMAPMMRMLVHNDGSVAHHHQGFNLPNLPMAHFYERCLTKVSPLSSAFASGMHRLVARRMTVLIDGGALPTAGFDSQAHAGTLSFEMSVGMQKLVTNIGSHDRLSVWGAAQRATAAHSTLVLNDTNSAEILPYDPDRPGSGGIGRQPQQVVAKPYETDAYLGIDLFHDGYRFMGGARHYRSLRLARDGDYLEGEDVITGPWSLPCVIRFHLHPDVKASLQADRQHVVIFLPKGRPWRFAVQGAQLELQDSVYLQGDSTQRCRQIVAHLPTQRPPANQAQPERRVLWLFEQIDKA